MSMLENIVGQVLQNAMQGNQPQQQSGLGGLLGGLAGGNQSQGGLGGLLGSVVSSQLGGNKQSSGLESVLGGLLGGQRSNNVGAGDLGSLLGSVLGGTSGKQSGGINKGALLVALLPVVLGYIQKNGGLSGVLSKFNNSGLGTQAQSWLSADVDNNGLDAGDITRLFGADEINNICQQTGASQGDVCQGIAELLPQVVNDLTPQGGLQNESEANQEIADLLGQLGK